MIQVEISYRRRTRRTLNVNASSTTVDRIFELSAVVCHVTYVRFVWCGPLLLMMCRFCVSLCPENFCGSRGCAMMREQLKFRRNAKEVGGI